MAFLVSNNSPTQPVVPNTSLAASAAKPKGKGIVDLSNVLMPIIFSNSTLTDLISSEDAFRSHKPLQNLSEKIKIQRLNAQKEEMLTANPEWRAIVNTWGCPLEDQVWLLKLFDFYKYDLHRRTGTSDNFPQIDSLFDETIDRKYFKQGILPADQINKVLMKRAEIKETFLGIKKIRWNETFLPTCPSALYWCENLEELEFCEAQLKTPPNLSKFPKLRSCILEGNELEVCPDIRKNPDLTFMSLRWNKIKTAPDFSQNEKLTVLKLNANLLSSEAVDQIIAQNANRKTPVQYL